MENNRSLRPLQKVVYLTEKIAKKLQWNEQSPLSLLNLDLIAQYLGDDQLLLLLTLNSVDDKSIGRYTPIGLANPIGITSLLLSWRESATTDRAQSALARLQSKMSVKEQNKVLQEAYETPDDDRAPHGDPYSIIHDEYLIGVVLSNEFNLNDKNALNQASNDIIGDIVRTYSIYHPPEVIAKDDWFKVYVSNL